MGAQMPIKVVEWGGVKVRVGAANGDIELRLLAVGHPEHRLTLDIETARELIAMLQRLLDARA
jgi:hypothetical protein